jgi:hypothetical protein
MFLYFQDFFKILYEIRLRTYRTGMLIVEVWCSLELAGRATRALNNYLCSVLLQLSFLYF